MPTAHGATGASRRALTPKTGRCSTASIRTLWLRLAEYGTAPDRFGLIHADMRLGNLLVDGDTVTLIDFDDCGFCWFAYDFAAAISFHETNPAIPALKAAWLEGYQAVRPLTPPISPPSTPWSCCGAWRCWPGSARMPKPSWRRPHMHGFADGTAQLAERYLRGPLWPSRSACAAGLAGARAIIAGWRW